jgi:7-cyano-7-deazaguanine reductase
MSIDLTAHGASDHLSLLGQSKTDYPTRPEDAVLECIPWNGTTRAVVVLDCPEFTCNCPRTNQPDFAKLTIVYEPNHLLIESKALKLYLFAFRNTGIFHEVLANRICSDLFAATQPKWMKVIADYLPRGGIAIKPTCSMGDVPDHHK